MSLSIKDGGLPPESVVQTEEQILQDSERLIRKYHDKSPFAMLRIALAPCSPFSVTTTLLRGTLALASQYDVLLHTHLAETQDEEQYCLEKFGRRPVDYMDEVGWLIERTWFAHMIHLSDSDLKKIILARVGVSHCPASNMRTAAGIAPIYLLKGSKVPVSIGIDGSAANDMNNMILELRTALLLQRIRYGANAMTPREMLLIGTRGGATVLHREGEIGSIEIGKAADLIMFKLDSLETAGGLNDPPAAVLFCDVKQVDFSMVNGKVLIEDGRFIHISEHQLRMIITKQNSLSRNLVQEIG